MQIQEAIQQMKHDPELVSRVKSDPVEALKQVMEGAPLATDKAIYRIVVAGLVLMGLFAITGGLTLAFYDKATPELVTAIGSAAVGALAGLLAPSPGRN